MWEEAKQGKGKRKVTEYKEDLASIFNIGVSSDCQDTHFCHSCHTFVRFWKAGKKGCTLPVGRVFTWCQHTDPECRVRNNSPMTFASHINWL